MLDKIKKLFNKHAGNIKKEYCSAIIVAAGSGTRMKTRRNKQFINLLGKPVLAYTLEAFEECRVIDEIIVVTREEDIILCKEIIDDLQLTKVKKIITGGKERKDSVYNGLKEISSTATLVAVHDGARPLILPEYIEMTVMEAVEYNAAALGVRVKDTIKVVDEHGMIINTPDRSSLWAVQTPQVFRTDILKKAYQYTLENGINATDDCMLVEQIGCKVKMVEGSYDNIKITTPEDIFVAESILECKEFEEEEED